MAADLREEDPTRLPRAILLNFGTPSLGYKRIVLSPEKICANLSESAVKTSPVNVRIQPA